MAKLKKRGKGIILFHDIQRVTGEAMPDLLARLKAGGYKIVHLVSKAPATSLPKYDKIVGSGFKGAANLAGARPLSSVVSTVHTAR